MTKLYLLVMSIAAICLLVGGVLVPRLIVMAACHGMQDTTPLPLWRLAIDSRCDGGVVCPYARNMELFCDQDHDGDLDLKDLHTLIPLAEGISDWHPTGWILCQTEALSEIWTKPGECWQTCEEDEESQATTCWMEAVEGQEIHPTPRANRWIARLGSWMTGPR